MIIVFLHGKPATGKLAVGRELEALTDFELFHNHIVVDKVLERHPFGTPEFVRDRDRLWRQHLAASAKKPDHGLIFTFNPENTVPQAFIDWIFTELPKQKVTVRSVELTASEAAIEERLGTGQRRKFKKLTDLEAYRRLRSAGVFLKPVIPRTDLKVDTEAHNVPDSARFIATRLHLTG